LHTSAAKFANSFSGSDLLHMNWRFPSRRGPFFGPVLFCHALALCCAVSCVKLPRRAQVVGAENTPRAEAGPARVNINRATREELGRLPGIGAGIAARIVEHRERNGPFRRVEHLLAVRGISEGRFEQLRALVAVE
jgi:competence ComEA-like helix-hairpin-helix protein